MKNVVIINHFSGIQDLFVFTWFISINHANPHHSIISIFGKKISVEGDRQQSSINQHLLVPIPRLYLLQSVCDVMSTAVLMTETSSSHVGEERAFHAAPRGSQHGPMQDSMDDFTTAEALDIFSEKLERALRRQKQEIVNELNLTSKSTEKKIYLEIYNYWA